ncbi:unnamed protein product, partial [Owenia fusiformis]
SCQYWDIMKLNRKWIVLNLLLFVIARAEAAKGTIDITADDEYNLFVNGKKVGSGDAWNQPQHYSIDNPENVKVIAVKAWDTLCIVSGLILSFRYGDFILNTNSSWKCVTGYVDPSWNQPGFNDRNWPAAVEFSTHRDNSYHTVRVGRKDGKPWWPTIDKAARVIWTRNNCRDRTIYCRYTLEVPSQPKTCNFKNKCKDKYWCNKGTCTPMVNIGEKCKKNVQCMDKSKCVDKKCQTSRPPKTCTFSNECKYRYWCDNGICVPMVIFGKNCTRNDQCLGQSKCVDGICEETCKIDNECLQYENGRKKYCTTGGLAAILKGKCVMKHEFGYRCGRSPECLGNMICKNGKCKKAEEVVQCSLTCVGPNPKKPDAIRPGSIVNVTYNCIFLRKGEFGHMDVRAKIWLNKHKLIGRVNGTSPQIFSGSYTKEAGKGEFAVALEARMSTCVNLKPTCGANRHCILFAGQ